MRITGSHILLLVGGILLLPLACRGQENRSRPGSGLFWVNGGLGYGMIYGGSAAATLSLNYQRRKHLFTARYLENSESLPLFAPQHISREAGLLYGWSGKGRVGYASLGVGLSLLRATVQYGYRSGQGPEKENLYTGPGIPLESQLFLTTRYAGIGLVLFANLNPHRSYAGYLLALQLGKLKHRRQ